MKFIQFYFIPLCSLPLFFSNPNNGIEYLFHSSHTTEYLQALTTTPKAIAISEDAT
jgi:hypothetical protein